MIWKNGWEIFSSVIPMINILYMPVTWKLMERWPLYWKTRSNPIWCKPSKGIPPSFMEVRLPILLRERIPYWQRRWDFRFQILSSRRLVSVLTWVQKNSSISSVSKLVWIRAPSFWSPRSGRWNTMEAWKSKIWKKRIRQHWEKESKIWKSMLKIWRNSIFAPSLLWTNLSPIQMLRYKLLQTNAKNWACPWK